MFNGDIYLKDVLLEKLKDDDFYYNKIDRFVALSASSIKDLVPPKSPRLWYYGGLKKDNEAALRAGTLFHNAILEPDKYEKLHFSNLKSRGAAGFKKQEQEIDDVLYTDSEKQFNEVLVNAFKKNDRAMSAIKDAKFEQPLAGYISNLPFRGKCDIITSENKIIDLKTTTKEMSDFKYTADSFGYDVQCYVYSKLLGVDSSGFEFIVISKNSLDIGFFPVDKSFLEQGKEKFDAAVDVYKNIFWGKSKKDIENTLTQMTHQETLTAKKKYYDR